MNTFKKGDKVFYGELSYTYLWRSTVPNHHLIGSENRNLREHEAFIGSAGRFYYIRVSEEEISLTPSTNKQALSLLIKEE